MNGMNNPGTQMMQNQMNPMNQMTQMNQMNPMMQQMQQQMMQQQMLQQQLLQQQMAQQQMMQNAAAQNMAQQANMQQQMQNILNNNPSAQGATGTSSNTPSSQPSGPGFCVIFRSSGQGGPQQAPVMVQCMPDDKVQSLIDKYRNKSGDNDPSKKFIFNAKNLSPSLSVAEAGIANNANIFVVTTKGVKGAF